MELHLTKYSTEEDVLQFLRENAFADLIDIFQGEPNMQLTSLIIHSFTADRSYILQ